MDSLTDSGLQSGFVLAVIIGAVLLAGYLGGAQGLAQRAAQVALGLALMMLVFSGTTAFHGLPAIPASGLEAAFDSELEFLDRFNESNQRSSEIGTIHIGLGILFVALGVGLVRKLSVITPPLLLGGILLILFGAPTTPEGGLGQLGSLLGGLGFSPGNDRRRGGRTRNRPIRGAARRGPVVDVAALFATGSLCPSDSNTEAPATEGTRQRWRPLSRADPGGVET